MFIALIILWHTFSGILYSRSLLLIYLSADNNSEYIVLSLFFNPSTSCIPGDILLL